MPKKALTTASVERIKRPKAGQADYFDRGYPGLALRVSYGGGKSWGFYFRDPMSGGKVRRITLGYYPAMGLADAREAWRDARRDVQSGSSPARRQKATAGFAGVVEEWLRRDQSENKSLREVTRIVERELMPAWGNRDISEIGRRDVLDLVDGIADRGAIIMARRVHAYAHRLFKWAVGRGIIGVNPAANLPKPGSETKRNRVLSDDELGSVWRQCGEFGFPYGPAVKLPILTGARRDEIGALKWSEVHGDTVKLEGNRTKNGEPHDIPLLRAACAIFDDLPRIAGSDFVFGRRLTTWHAAKARIDISTPWRLHDLRRTVATGLQRLGVNLQTIEAVLGHISGSRGGIVGVYQRHSFDAEKRAALNAWGAYVTELGK